MTETSQKAARWARHKAWIIPTGTFVLGILAAGVAQFGADWATDARRGELPAPSASTGCVPEWRDAISDTELIDILVSPSIDAHCWTRSMELDGAETFDVQIRYGNFTDATVHDVVVESWLPEGVELVAGTTKIANTTNPDGLLLDQDEILGNGVNIGSYDPRSVAYLMFRAKVTSAYQSPCGINLLGAFARTWHPNPTDWVSAGVVTEVEC